MESKKILAAAMVMAMAMTVVACAIPSDDVSAEDTESFDLSLGDVKITYGEPSFTVKQNENTLNFDAGTPITVMQSTEDTENTITISDFPETSPLNLTISDLYVHVYEDKSVIDMMDSYVNMTLIDGGGSFTIDADTDVHSAAVRTGGNSLLTVYANDVAALWASITVADGCSIYGAGIGGSENEDGNIVLNGVFGTTMWTMLGNPEGTCNIYAAGIGGGDNGDGNITMTDGWMDAGLNVNDGTIAAAGIGAGRNGNCNLNMSGGTMGGGLYTNAADSLVTGACIGGSESSGGSIAKIDIFGGEVKADIESMGSVKAAGIGAGYGGTAAVNIMGGTITSTLSSDKDQDEGLTGIGKGLGESQCDVTITGGSIKAVGFPNEITEPKDINGNDLYKVTLDIGKRTTSLSSIDGVTVNDKNWNITALHPGDGDDDDDDGNLYLYLPNNKDSESYTVKVNTSFSITSETIECDFTVTDGTVSDIHYPEDGRTLLLIAVVIIAFVAILALVWYVARRRR